MGRHIAKQDPESLELKRIRDAMAAALPGEIGMTGSSREINERKQKAGQKYLRVFYDSTGDLQTRHEAGKRAALKKYLGQSHFESIRQDLIAVFDKVFDDAKKG